MEFRETQPIYLQIADHVCEKVMLREWKPESRIPSVRELAIQLEVNPNTVMRTYEFLQQAGIVYNQRGVGLFLAAEAYAQALEYRRAQFIEKEMPYFFRSMSLLQLEIGELEIHYKKFKKVTPLKPAKP